MNLIVLCDFDGTITIQDTAELVLRKFAKGDWKQYDQQFENGKLSLEECLKKEFSLVKASREEILNALNEVEFRPGFDELARYCKQNCIPVIIVSAGLDFIIIHFLKLKKWHHMVQTYMAVATVAADGIKFTFPRHCDKTSANFKQDLVRKCKGEGKKIVLIGDGTGDCDAAREADLTFAIKDSSLANLCEKYGIHCRSMTDFRQVIDVLRSETPFL